MSHNFSTANPGTISTTDQQGAPVRPLPLARYGWTDRWAAEFAGLQNPNLIPGRVIRAERHTVQVATESGLLSARHHTSTDARDPIPCTGDWVALETPTNQAEASVRYVLHRRTALVRSSASGHSLGQTLATNVDTVAIVVSSAAPLRHTRTERMLALAWESGAIPIIVLTKADLATDAAQAEAEMAEIALGAETLLTSVVSGLGLARLAEALTGTIVLLGSSGAGKSTLGNALLGGQQLATGAIRDIDGKGRHTTAWRELVPLPGGGVLIDTPGLRTIGLQDAADGIEQTFADVVELALRCRFTDCGHESEPGCAVQGAIESGALAARRLDSYRKLLRENLYQESRTDARLRADQSDKWKGLIRQRRVADKIRNRHSDRTDHN